MSHINFKGFLCLNESISREQTFGSYRLNLKCFFDQERLEK